MTAQPIKIELTATGNGTVNVSGHDVSNDVHILRLDAEVGEPTRLELDLVARPVVFNGDAEVTLAPATRAMLKASGWTPPARPSDVELMTGQRNAGVWDGRDVHAHRASCHGEIGEFICGKVEAARHDAR